MQLFFLLLLLNNMKENISEKNSKQKKKKLSPSGIPKINFLFILKKKCNYFLIES